MARGINKVILIGNVGADPETRYQPNGNQITSIKLATTDSWKDKSLTSSRIVPSGIVWCSSERSLR